jgi:competence protein ComEC
LLALIIGDTSLFSDDQQHIYHSLGAQHLLAVSGLQVSLIAMLIFFMLRPLAIFLVPRTKTHYSYIIAAIITLIIIWLFVALCDWPKSAVRAALMSSMMLTPILFARKPDLFDALFSSAFLSLLVEPLALLDLGFLLSYSALFGILCAHESSHSLRQKLAPKSIIIQSSVALIISSLSAFLATLPIISYFFGSVAPLSALANFFLVPFASLMQIPAIIASFLGTSLNSKWLIKSAAFCASSIEIVAEFLTLFFNAHLYLPHDNFIIFSILFVALFLLFISLLQIHKLAITLSFVSIISLFSIFYIQEDRKSLIIRVLPVGQGDASLFSFPSGQHMLIDAGGQAFGSFDPGLAIIVPTLKRLAIKSLDLLVITHPDPDHILGAFAILDTIPVKEIWHNGDDSHPLTMRLKEHARAKNIKIKNPSILDEKYIFGSSIITLFSPASDPALSTNNNSLVLKITHDMISLLWPGDIEALAEHKLLKYNNNLYADIIKAPHHGSKTSSTKDFVEIIKPKVVIYSTGLGNKFNFPHEEVVERYNNIGAMSYNTATDGEITLRIHNKQLAISTFIRRL